MESSTLRVISATTQTSLSDGIASQYGLHDSLISGSQLSLAKELSPKHPLEDSSSLMEARSSYQSMKLLVGMETKILSNISRLSGLPSSKLSLSILNNSIDTIEVEDFMNCIFTPSLS